MQERVIKLFERFNNELEDFRKETGDDFATLYEDACTTRDVKDFHLYKNGTLTWKEEGRTEREKMFDEDEAKEYLSFWRSCLRRAKKYWATDPDTLDKIQNGEIEEDEED